MCVDYRELNKNSIEDKNYPLLLIGDDLELIRITNCVFESQRGVSPHKCRVEASVRHTLFTTPLGQFELF